jgi:hypothetical protein
LALKDVRDILNEIIMTPPVKEETPERHTHPPVYGLVDQCPYCQTFGNVFQDGTIPLNESKLRPYMHCFDGSQSFKKMNQF